MRSRAIAGQNGVRTMEALYCCGSGAAHSVPHSVIDIDASTLKSRGYTIRSMSTRKTIFLFALTVSLAMAQNLSVKWEELTAGDFMKAIEKSRGTCIPPFGVLEKHGPHLPLGNDLINVRYLALHGAQQEFSVVFPEYYFGQIFEAKHEPGTIAYSPRLQLELLQETTDEMSRNGCKKILILNGHGGNNHLLPFFAQSQLAAQKDYVVYVYFRGPYPPGRPPMKSKTDLHAGESETAHTLVSRPDLVTWTAQRLNRARIRTASIYRRWSTGIWWYGKFPHHYAGEGAAATKELGEFDMKAQVANVANVLRAIKADQVSPRLQQEFRRG